MLDKAMTPDRATCPVCNGKKTVTLIIKGVKTEKVCISCKGTGTGKYATK